VSAGNPEPKKKKETRSPPQQGRHDQEWREKIETKKKQRRNKLATALRKWSRQRIEKQEKSEKKLQTSDLFACSQYLRSGNHNLTSSNTLSPTRL